MMEFLTTILGTVLGSIFWIIVLGAFFLYLLSHFINFALRGLKLIGIFVVLAIFAFIIDFFGLIFSSDEDQATKIQSSEYNQSDPFKTSDNFYNREEEINDMLYNFLMAYEANDLSAVALYMDENADITKQHLDYMIYQQKQGIVLDLIDYELTEVISLSSNTFEATTTEHFGVNHPINGVQDIHQKVQYNIKLSNGKPVIHDLKVLGN